jgi:trehalose 6-phosphate synthase
MLQTRHGDVLLTVSNRGPVEYRWSGGGGLEAVPGQGGLATALRVAAQIRPAVWLSSPLTPVDRLIAEGAVGAPGGDCGSRFVATDPAAYDLFYSRFSNEVLWFVQHGLTAPDGIDALSRAAAWDDGYRPVNEAFAREIVAELDSGTFRAVMFHDYHFYLAPRLVRQSRPEVYLQHFIHIPWPVPETWQQLEPRLLREICRGILGNDSIVFQTPESASNFLHTCELSLSPNDFDVDLESGSVSDGHHETRVWSNGISVDPEELQEAVDTPEFSRYRWDLRPNPGVKTIVRVDRLDLTKNVVRGFEAYRMLLRDHPELRGKVTFLALLVPSRSDIEAYRSYAAEAHAIVADINREFGGHGWKPVKLIFENNRTQGLAAMSLYDVLLVNPIADGMNLVAKEGPMVNTRDGALVLSRRAGAFDALGPASIGVDPEDVAATAEALYNALEMSPVERHHRATHLRALIRAHDLRAWFRFLIDDIDRNAPSPLTSKAVYAA